MENPFTIICVIRTYLYILGWCFLSLTGFCDEPTEVKAWKAKSGHAVTAKALSITKGKVTLERENGKQIKVPLTKLNEKDQEFLNKHFRVAEKALEALKPPEGKPADDLPFSLGEMTAEISAAEEFSYYLYLPKSLREGKKHPVIFVMNPGGGSEKEVKRYKDGAERNRWIIAISKQSRNGFNGSQDAIDAMIDHVKSTLPIDNKRMYTSGFSGGSRMACHTSKKHSEIAGIIACGAANPVGGKKQVVYGLCGTNCFNRKDMASSSISYTHKGSMLRFFPGRHSWANTELCEDAMTHLNGVFLCKNQSRYEDEYKYYTFKLGEWVKDLSDSNPQRAYMWADFANRYEIENSSAGKAFSSLGSDSRNKLFVKGLYDIKLFAEKYFGKTGEHAWKADAKVSAACLGEAKNYEGSPWQIVLTKMSEDAQKY